jgi:hypothetical protein
LIEVQETTKQREAEARRVEYEAHVQQLEIQRVQKVRRGDGDVAVVTARGLFPRWCLMGWWLCVWCAGS